MINRAIVFLTLLTPLFFTVPNVFAGEVVFEITDQKNNKIKDAVVMLYAEDGLEVAFGAPYPPVMAQRDMKFIPHVLPVMQGAIVSFPNQDETRHHVYSFSSARTIELRLYEGGAERTVDFPTAGEVILGCNIHDSMLGYIYVSDTPVFLRSDELGQAHFQNLPAGNYKMRIWHPRLRGKATDHEQMISINHEEPLKITKSLRLKRERKNRSAY